MAYSRGYELWAQTLRRSADDGAGWCVSVYRNKTAVLSLADDTLAVWRELPADVLIRELEELAAWLRVTTGVKPAACARCRAEPRREELQT